MVWGTTGGNSKCCEEILEPLGLVSYGGGTDIETGDMTYRIFSEENDFTCELIWQEINEVEKIYKTYLRKRKLKNVTNRKKI